MATVNIYDEGLLMGSGTLTSGSTSVTSWTVNGGWNATGNPRAVARKNVQIAVGALGTFNTRITADNGAGTLTLKDACPFTSA